MIRKTWMIALLAAVGCGTPASDTTTTLVAFNPDGAPVAEFEAPGMHCQMCAASIVKVLKEKPGVIDVKADAATKIVSVAYADDEFESDFAIEAVAEAGFGEATPVEAASAEETPAEEATVEG